MWSQWKFEQRMWCDLTYLSSDDHRWPHREQTERGQEWKQGEYLESLKIIKGRIITYGLSWGYVTVKVVSSVTHLNAEFQRIAKRDKKAILSNQCKEIEENNRRGKTRDLFKKIRDIKGTFHSKMVSIKDRNGMDLTEAEDIKKRWQEYTKVYKKDLHTQIITMVWSLTYSKTSWNVKSSGPQEASLWTKLVGVMEFQLSYFKSWKMMLWKCCIQYVSKLGKLSSGHRTGKGQFWFQSQRKTMPKNAQIIAQLHSSHTLVKWSLKFSKPGFSNTWTVNFQLFKLYLEKEEEPEIKLPISAGSLKKQESSRKTSISVSWLCQSVWLCGSQ